MAKAVIGIRLAGIDTALAQLNREIRRIKRVSKKALIRAGFLIKREAQSKTPVMTGNLKSSAFVTWGGKGIPHGAPSFKGKDAGKMASEHLSVVAGETARAKTYNAVEVGYTAYYAIFVHENLTVHHKSGEAKFLENAIRENKDRIVELIVLQDKKEV